MFSYKPQPLYKPSDVVRGRRCGTFRIIHAIRYDRGEGWLYRVQPLNPETLEEAPGPTMGLWDSMIGGLYEPDAPSTMRTAIRQKIASDLADELQARANRFRAKSRRFQSPRMGVAHLEYALNLEDRVARLRAFASR